MRLLVALHIAVGITSALALWPLPRDLKTGQTALKLSKDFSIDLSGIRHAPDDLKDAVKRTVGFVKNDGLQALVVDRGASAGPAVKSAKSLKTLKLSVGQGTAEASDATADGARLKSIAQDITVNIEDRREGYTLVIPADGSAATLQAPNALGLFRGLTTFSQIWFDLDGTAYTLEAPFHIVDSPAYPYRGLMLDTARNFYPVADIKRQLDAASWVKINTFHWHIVDSQSFPLIIPGLEVLAEKGAYNNKAVYTPADIKEIVAYANARGIDVFPEIDTPGHTTVIGKAFPQHIACPDATPWTEFANQPPAGQLRFANAETTNFTSRLLTSASTLFSGKYFGTGGDEINANCYDKDPQTQEDLIKSGKTIDQALNDFTVATHAALKFAGKSTFVWEEMLLKHPVDLANDTVILAWLSPENVAQVTAKGFRVVHASNEYFYLDCGAGGWVGQHPLGNSWCDPFKTWQKAYTFNPVANLDEKQAKLVLGGQHLLWSEQSSPSNVDSIVWPRAASGAEVFWSGPGGDLGKAFHRLHEVSYRFNKRGVRAIALQPEWCALRPGACDLNA